jgi:TolB-like protein/Tfp pilus assembly protein PilF
MNAFLHKIKERRVLKTLVLYVATAWGVLQAIDFFSNRYNSSPVFFEVTLITVICFFPLALMLAWIYGAPGKQRASRGELALLSTNLIIAVVIIGYVASQGFFHERKRNPIAQGRSRVLIIPFTTTDTSRIYFADGITTDLVTEIGKIRAFTTLAWNTSFKYANTQKSFKDIAGETQATHLLIGKVQRNASKVRINVSLVNPDSDEVIWTESWDEDIDRIFDIQKQIAVDVSRELSIRLTSEEERLLSARYRTQNMEAYDLLLKARAEIRTFYSDPGPLYRATRYLEQALTLDPDFPDALVVKAYIRTELAWLERLDPVEEFKKGQSEIQKALQRYPTSSDAHAVAGLINFFFGWNMEEARKSFEKSWQLSNYGETSIYQCNCGYVGYQIAKGNYQQALQTIEQIEKLDPNYVYGSIERLIAYRSLGDTAKIRARLNSVDDHERTQPYEAAYFYELGQYQKSIRSFEQSGTDFIWPTSYLASAYYKGGMVAKSDSMVQDMIRRSATERNYDLALAVVYAARKDKANAIKWFKRAYENHDYWLPYSRGDADLKLILNEPEVVEILHKVGL